MGTQLKRSQNSPGGAVAALTRSSKDRAPTTQAFRSAPQSSRDPPAACSQTATSAWPLCFALWFHRGSHAVFTRPRCLKRAPPQLYKVCFSPKNFPYLHFLSCKNRRPPFSPTIHGNSPPLYLLYFPLHTHHWNHGMYSLPHLFASCCNSW